MKINSVNAINNQKFGMAKFANPNVLAKLAKKVPKEDALRLIKVVHESGCKNTSIVDVVTNSGYHDVPIESIIIALPKHALKSEVVTYYLPNKESLASKIVETEKDLAELILYKAAQKGNLDKTKVGLIGDLPELQEHIIKYCDTPGLVAINANAKARVAYKKAHPILSIFHIPKNIS